MTLHHILLLLAATTLHFSDNRRLIDDLIDKLKSSQTKSISPSWEGIRRFDLIGTGKLPLQSHKVVTDYQGELLEDKREDDNRRVYSVDQADSLRRIPGQFSRNRNNPDSGLQRFPSDTASRQPVNYRYNQDPETKIRNNYDRFGLTWTDGAQRRNRRSASPYNRIKIKIANPFYFSNPKRRRLRLKKVVSAPAPSRQISGPQGFWEDNNFDRNFFDPDLSLYDYDEGEDLLQQVGGREPEPLSSDDMYQTEQYTEEERQLLGSGNYIVETGGTFYDEDDGGYSDSQYFPVGQFSHNNVDNFRDFADIKRERLFRHRRRYRY